MNPKGHDLVGRKEYVEMAKDPSSALLPQVLPQIEIVYMCYGYRITKAL